MDATTDTIESFVNSDYKYGFVSDIETDAFAPGLSEDTVRRISEIKGEPDFLREWRLKAYRHWTTMTEPHWPNVHYPPIDYQSYIYYAAAKERKKLGSLDEVDPELRRTFEKLGISLDEQKRLSGVAVDAVLDSVSVATTFKEELARQGIIFCSFSEAVKNHPDLVRKYLGTVVPTNDNFFAALNSAVFSDGSFCYIPKGVRCPMELSTYFRINTAGSGQFERTLIIADEGSQVSYLEGCTAPMRDTNQLHAAVVELIALENASIKYSTVQNWYPGDKDGKGGIYNFVTKRGKCAGRNSKISWTQVETGSAITWKYPSVLLLGRQLGGRVLFRRPDQSPAAGRHRDENGPRRPEHQQHHRLQGHLGGPGAKQLSRAGENPQKRRGRAQLFAVRFAPHGGPLRGAHLPLRGSQE